LEVAMPPLSLLEKTKGYHRFRGGLAVIILAGISLFACGDETTGPGTVARVDLTPESTTLVSLGETVQLNATAFDAAGETVSGATFTWTSTDNGVVNLGSDGLVSARRNGSASITATAAAVDGTATVIVDQVGTHLAFTADPGSATTGNPFSVQVEIRDANNNVAANSSEAVTIAIGVNPSGGTLSGATTVNAVGGLALFDNLSIDNAGDGYTLTASAPSMSGTTSDEFEVSSTAPANATRILLTDDPFPYDRIERVDRYFVSVSGSLSPDTGSSAAGFVTLAEPHRLINLLELQNGITDELGAVVLPEGAITAVRVVIDTDSSSITLKDGSVLTGTSSPGIAWQSSAGRPVLNALIHEQIEVPDTGAVVAIIYDVGRAFFDRADGGFTFSPVLSAADARRTGSIAGTVRAGTADGAPVQDVSLRLYLGGAADPENTWITWATARSDTAGLFRFSFIPPSTHWLQFPARAGDTYIVAADPPSGLGLGRVVFKDVQVVAGVETEIGVLILP
jgi:hypothetical protein